MGRIDWIVKGARVVVVTQIPGGSTSTDLCAVDSDIVLVLSKEETRW